LWPAIRAGDHAIWLRLFIEKLRAVVGLYLNLADNVLLL
jgi:hypothetical protein